MLSYLFFPPQKKYLFFEISLILKRQGFISALLFQKMNSPFRIGFFSSNFSAAAGNRHAELFHLDCSFAKIVNAFCLRLCLLPGGSPNVDSVAADDHCVRLGVVADCLRHGIFEVFFVERVFDDLLCLLKLYKNTLTGMTISSSYL